ncbi:MAG: BamA/TamA family outer membrane protein [Bacteroidales bacterium]|nr:BamA/TamA family outer membrane protein [Bacteroidales bacterium]
MNKTLQILLAVVIVPLVALSQPDEKVQVKKGWNFGALPAVSFNTDLGFQYGALINLFHYGDGSRYPVYDHSLYLEASRYTKGSGLLRFSYDSDRLIKNLKTSFDLSYLPEQAISFFGFNGYDAIYNKAWEDDTDAAYKSRVFYRHKRDMWRIITNVSGKLVNDNILWSAGLDFYAVKIASVDVDRLNRGKDEQDKLPSLIDQPGLFEKYKQWGVLPVDELNGGTFTGLKLGLVYDSRDFEPNPMHGLWTDMILYAAPKFLSDLDKGFIQLSVTHRQYFTLVKDKLSFVYRLSYQQKIGGHIPFYALPLLITTQMKGAYSEGLGGDGSVRGLMRNRVVGEGIVYGNTEFRWKFYKTRIWNQNIYCGLNTFIDAGMVVDKVPVDAHLLSLDPSNHAVDYFAVDAEKMHWTGGLGLKLVMNENFIISGDVGRALNEQDGGIGIYIGLNYLF